MKLIVTRRRRRTTIQLEIGDVVLTVEFPRKREPLQLCS